VITIIIYANADPIPVQWQLAQVLIQSKPLTSFLL